MNKQELIKKYKRLEGVWNAPGAETARQIFLQDLEQLDEPEKVTIPQVIAEYIEQKKDDDYHLLGAMIEIRSHKNKEIDEWFEFKEDDNMETFARAWLDGYEIEKERRYTVVMKGTKQPLFYNNLHERLFFSLGELATRFTRKQIEDAGLGEVFNSPLFEVEEVE